MWGTRRNLLLNRIATCHRNSSKGSVISLGRSSITPNVRALGVTGADAVSTARIECALPCIFRKTQCME